jgi:hypothetical protein
MTLRRGVIRLGGGWHLDSDDKDWRNLLGSFQTAFRKVSKNASDRSEWTHAPHPDLRRKSSIAR